MVAVILCALAVQAQDTPADATWESDPLDVLEPQAPADIPQPVVPEFTEVPEAHAVESTESTPPAPVDAPTVTTSTPSWNTSPDEPDTHRESEFHRIYKSYNESPTSDESWDRAMAGRPAEVYRVQKGDTLSGISGTLFGDPFFWPKVWSLNTDQILNPHEIAPDMGVQFFPGSLSEPPTLGVVAPADQSLSKVPVPPPPSPTALAGVTLPAAKRRTPLLEKLPGSLPGTRLNTVVKVEDDIRLELMKHKYPKAFEYLGYYVQDEPLEGVGTVTGAETGADTVGEYQYIYVKLEQTPAKKYIVQKNLTQVEDPRNEARKAQMIQVQGAIEVMEKVNEAENIYRAMVTKAINPVEKGSVLTPGDLPMIDTEGGTPAAGVGATIIGGQFEKRRSLFGQNSLVFLDGGRSQGLQEGQTLSIFADARVRNKNTPAVQNDRVIGTLKLVRVTNNFATAYVVRASDDVLVGDYAGKMTSAAALRSDSPSMEPGADIVPESGSDDFDLEL